MKLVFNASTASSVSTAVEPNLLPFEMVQSFIASNGTPNALKLQDVFNEKYIYYSVHVLGNGKHIVIPIVLFVGRNSESGNLQLLSCDNKCVVNILTEESAAIYENYDECKKFVDKANEIIAIQSTIDRHVEHMDDIIKVEGVEPYWHHFANLSCQLAQAKIEIADL